MIVPSLSVSADVIHWWDLQERVQHILSQQFVQVDHMVHKRMTCRELGKIWGIEGKPIKPSWGLVLGLDSVREVLTPTPTYLDPQTHPVRPRYSWLGWAGAALGGFLYSASSRTQPGWEICHVIDKSSLIALKTYVRLMHVQKDNVYYSAVSIAIRHTSLFGYIKNVNCNYMVWVFGFRQKCLDFVKSILFFRAFYWIRS